MIGELIIGFDHEPCIWMIKRSRFPTVSFPNQGEVEKKYIPFARIETVLLDFVMLNQVSQVIINFGGTPTN